MTIPFMRELLQVKIIPIRIVKPSEYYNLDTVNLLVKCIECAGIWTHPIIIEKQNFIIMDGHHRFQAAKNLGLKNIPAFVIGYDNPYLKLTSRIPEQNILAENVIKAGLTGKLLNYKSTCHNISIDMPKTKIQISDLNNSQPFRIVDNVS